MIAQKSAFVCLIIFLLVLCGCSGVSSGLDYLEEISTGSETECSTVITDSVGASLPTLPDIKSFSSTEYEENTYMFPPVESAVYICDGITETLDPSDPRLFRLLNALIYSYSNSKTAWLQGSVEGDECLSYIRSGDPMLDIRFRVEEEPPVKTDFSTTPRAIISANCYLLIIDTSSSTISGNKDVLCANMHYPFLDLLAEYNGTIAADYEWANSRWIDLLAYSGFH